jgi:hypothetical protein
MGVEASPRVTAAEDPHPHGEDSLRLLGRPGHRRTQEKPGHNLMWPKTQTMPQTIQTTPPSGCAAGRLRSNDAAARRQGALAVTRSTPCGKGGNHPGPMARPDGYARIYGVVYACKGLSCAWA